MQSKFVFETIGFERGGDPKDALRIGNVHNRRLERGREEIKRALSDVVKKHGGKFRVYIVKNSMGDDPTGMRGMWTPPQYDHKFAIDLHKAADEKYYFTPEEYNEHGGWEGSYGGRINAEKAAQEMISRWGGKINESLDFERGLEPRRAMKVGKHRNDLFNQIQSMPFVRAMRTFSELGSDNDRKILSLAAHMLKVPEEEVRIAMDKDVPIYGDSHLLDEYLERDWQYGLEDSLESGSMSFDLIGSSTGEIYVKDRKTDEFLYILGAIN
jgi:hypothetical protein